jgi:hypothetical protein
MNGISLAIKKNVDKQVERFIKILKRNGHYDIKVKDDRLYAISIINSKRLNFKLNKVIKSMKKYKEIL